MTYDVVVPEIGEVGMEVTFVGWHKSAGDSVHAGDVLFTVDTAKATVEVEAYADGVLQDLQVEEGDLVQPQQVVAHIVGPAQEAIRVSPSPAATLAGTAGEEKRAEVTDRPEVQTAHRVSVSPKARHAALEAGIDLASVSGSGSAGMVTERDVQAAVTSRRSSSGDRRRFAAEGGSDRPSRASAAVAELTQKSWREVPHFYLSCDADVEHVLRHAKPTEIVFLAAARALKMHPECNLAWDGATVVRRPSIDIGLLVDAPDGLRVCTVANAASLDAAAMAAALADAKSRARSGVLAPMDLVPRSLTVSNLGMYSVDRFEAIILPPEVLMLAVGRTHFSPHWDGEAWSPRREMDLTLSVDHRALSGASAARFLTVIESLLASPETLFD